MSEAAPTTPPPLDWRKVHAYGLPEGSVRALMALMIFGCLWAHLLIRPDREIPESLTDLLFIVLGHYFAVRSRSEPAQEPGPPPLYLPRGAVRLMLVAGFVAVGLVLQRRGKLVAVDENPGVVTLLLVAGFLLGVVLQKVVSWLTGGGRPLPRLFEDARATVSLVAAVLLTLLVWDQVLPFLPESIHTGLGRLHLGLGRFGPEHLLAAVVGFYFGSRS